MPTVLDLIAILILTAVPFVVIVFLINTYRHLQDVNGFFSTHVVDQGIVMGYSQPRHQSNHGFIELQCDDGKIRWIAKYKIPMSDYGKFSIGQEAPLSANWTCWGYTLL